MKDNTQVQVLTFGEKPVNITEDLQVLFDFAINSMDWGSSFADVEDAEAILHIAEVCGFERVDDIKTYLEEQVHSKEVKRFWETLPPVSHKHHYIPITDTIEICNYPDCYVKQGSDEDIAGDTFRRQYTGELPHDHVYSSIGKCMWPRCHEQEGKG